MLSFNPITGQFDLVNPAADISGKLDLTGGTMTGQLILQNASATGAVNVSPTWNNAGTDFVGIYGRVTNTASGAASKLIDVGTVAAGSKFWVDLNGYANVAQGGFTTASLRFDGANTGFSGIGGARLDGIIGGVGVFSSDANGTNFYGPRVAANKFSFNVYGFTGAEIRNGTGTPEGSVSANPGSLYLDNGGGPPYYKNTGTGNTGWVAADISGKLDLTGGTVTGQLVLTNASATGALNLAPTWNNAGTDFAGIYSRVTNTASGANSRLMSLGTVAGGELFGIVPNGNIMLGYDGHIKFNAGAADAGAEDVGIVRTAVGTLKVSDAGTGHGTLDVLGLAVSGAPGATYSGAVLSITVINGIVTAVA